MQSKLSSIPISKELFNKVIDNYLNQYINIPPKIKSKIKIFAEYYYFSIKTDIEKSKNEILNLFPEY
jgi:hypothetical protein